MLLLLDLFGLGLFFGGILISDFVNLTVCPLFTKLVNSKINMKVDSSLHLRFRYFFSKEKNVNKFIIFLHNFNQISFAIKLQFTLLLLGKSFIISNLHNLLLPLSSFRKLKVWEELGA